MCFSSVTPTAVALVICSFERTPHSKRSQLRRLVCNMRHLAHSFLWRHLAHIICDIWRTDVCDFWRTIIHRPHLAQNLRHTRKVYCSMWRTYFHDMRCWLKHHPQGPPLRATSSIAGCHPLECWQPSAMKSLALERQPVVLACEFLCDFLS